MINLLITRWTFFRVKLVFEFEFEISWSLGPWDLGTPGPWNPWTLEPLDLGTLGPLPSSNTSSYFPLHPLTSSYLFLLLSSFCSASRVVIFLFFGHNYDFFQKIVIIMVRIYKNSILFQNYGVYHAKNVEWKDF